MDYGYRSPQGQIWSCDSLQTAQEIVTEAPHMEIVAREPDGEWETVPPKSIVTQYDIGTRKIWATMGREEAEAHVRCAYELGDTVQEYDTTDLSGNPLRVVLHICVTSPNPNTDQGGVYEFTR
ncbi:hypothetical protein [Streptomyces sp. NPDC051016]|uniref:hypothetical protein n=1 Tax=Streptomyces sp. NPDC051016 TaxID=3365638 RepID=UPI00379B7DD2